MRDDAVDLWIQRAMAALMVATAAGLLMVGAVLYGH
jgi:hypothetical protein